MTIDLTIQAPGTPDEVLSVQLPADTMRAVDLLRARAGAEWDAHGRIGREAAPPLAGDAPAPQSRDEAIRATVDAFRAGWFVVFVDGEPAMALDERIALRNGTRIRFTRLYPGRTY